MTDPFTPTLPAPLCLCGTGEARALLRHYLNPTRASEADLSRLAQMVGAGGQSLGGTSVSTARNKRGAG